VRSLASTTSPLIDSHSLARATGALSVPAGVEATQRASGYTHPLGVYLHIDAFHASFIIVMFACRRP
jgi:hypothetical protein